MSSDSSHKAVYKQIAIDVAKKIVMGKLREGEKIHGRSTLAGQYNVSPETVRRAVSLLEETGVLTVKQGVGIFIKSLANAQEFIEKNTKLDNIDGIRKNILTLVYEQQELNKRLSENVSILLDANDRFNYLNPITPFELAITKGCALEGKSYAQVNFWNKTGATIIAVKRNNTTILSPGPDEVFSPNDYILIVGDEISYKRAKEYLGIL